MTPKPMNRNLTLTQLIQKNSIFKFIIFIAFAAIALFRGIPAISYAAWISEAIGEFSFYLFIEPAVYLMIFAVCAVGGVIGFVQLKDPSKSKLGKNIIRYAGTGSVADIRELFSKVEADMANSDPSLDEVWLGEEWLVGKTGLKNYGAIRLDRIKGIFYEHVIKTVRGGSTSNELWVHAVDDNNHDVPFRFNNKGNMIALYEALCGRFPDATRGNHEDFENYLRGVSI